MSDFESMIEKFPTLGSVRSRLGLYASITEQGELNTLLNDAYTSMGNYEKALGETMIQSSHLYTELACDADLMRQLPETHPVKQAMRSYERTYLGRTEG